MTEPNSIPPVGATVAVGLDEVERVTGHNFYGDPIWSKPLTKHDNVRYSAVLTIVWRIQQERDQLKAESHAIMQTYAIESDRSLAECVTRTVDGWRERCETAEARAAKLEKDAKEAEAACTMMRDLLREVAGSGVEPDNSRIVTVQIDRVAALRQIIADLVDQIVELEAGAAADQATIDVLSDEVCELQQRVTYWSERAL